MIKPHFLFTQHQNSYSVKVKNLERLSVEQIQTLETFVKNRNGIFNFETYSFVIQKRLSFNMFEVLLDSLNIKVFCEEHILQKQTFKRIGFGQYKGMQYNELPDTYLIWLKSNYRGFEKEDIAQELQRRKL